ncbi:MAG: terminase [Pseudomonadota bacterium]
MPIQKRFTRQNRAAFLAALSETANVSASCQLAGVSRSAAYATKRRDAVFAAAWEEAIQSALDALEVELIRRAIEGTEHVQYYHGKPIGSVRHYSDALAMFLLKSRRPATYGDLKTVVEAPDKADQDARAAALDRLLQALEKVEANTALVDRVIN